MKFSQIFLFSIISSISCAPVNIQPLFNVADNVAAESATAATRASKFRFRSARTGLSEGITDNARVPVVDVVPDNAATAAANKGRPRLDRVQSAPALIDTTRIPNPKIEENAAELAAKTRKDIAVGLLAGGFGGLTAGLAGAAVIN